MATGYPAPSIEPTMSLPTKYDAIIIGTGQAGPSLAYRLSAVGMSVAIIERKLFGGTCVNTGCIPTKAIQFGQAEWTQRARVIPTQAETGLLDGSTWFER